MGYSNAIKSDFETLEIEMRFYRRIKYAKHDDEALLPKW